LVLAAVHHQVVSAFSLLVAYGVGAALPLVAIAYIAVLMLVKCIRVGAIQQFALRSVPHQIDNCYSSRRSSSRLLRLRAHSGTLQRLGGIMVAGTAIAILLGWDVQVQLWLAPFFPRLPL